MGRPRINDSDRPTCTGPECDRPCYGRQNVCDTYYQQRRNRPGKPLTPIRVPIGAKTRDADGNKPCYGCGAYKPEAEFYRQAAAADGLTARCMDCTKIRIVEQRFGMAEGSYLKMLAEQNGVCYLCHKPDPRGHSLSVDHDHACCPERSSCGECVRRLLCGNCNTAIGLLREDVDVMERATAYVRHYRK